MKKYEAPKAVVNELVSSKDISSLNDWLAVGAAGEAYANAPIVTYMIES